MTRLGSFKPARRAATSLFGVLALLSISGWDAPSAQASVVLNGTRVIYQGGQHGKTLQLTNEDAHPNLVQVWVDDDAPFVLNPPIFRMEPHAGQMVRLRVEDAGLPKDRESVFYLNFTQVPALDEAAAEANRLVLLLQSRVKLFYRPKGLAQQRLSCKSLHVQRKGDQLTVENSSPYHVVVNQAVLSAGGKHVPLAQAQMLTPFSTTTWVVPAQAAGAKAAAQSLELSLRNDYGSDVNHVCSVA